MDVSADLRAQLLDLISGDTLPKDGRLPPERDLAAQLGVSRARLRQVLDLLEREGAVYRRQGSGTFATPPTQDGSGPLGRLARAVTPHDIMEVRLEVEPALAAHAASRARPDDLARLEQFMRATLTATEPHSYETADDVFHYHIALAAKNPLFLEIFDSIRTVRKLMTWGARREQSHTPEAMARFAIQHRTLFEAIAAHDTTEAARLMQMHLLDVNQAVLRGALPAEKNETVNSR